MTTISDWIASGAVNMSSLPYPPSSTIFGCPGKISDELVEAWNVYNTDVTNHCLALEKNESSDVNIESSFNAYKAAALTIGDDDLQRQVTLCSVNENAARVNFLITIATAKGQEAVRPLADLQAEILAAYDKVLNTCMALSEALNAVARSSSVSPRAMISF